MPNPLARLALLDQSSRSRRYRRGHGDVAPDRPPKMRPAQAPSDAVRLADRYGVSPAPESERRTSPSRRRSSRRTGRARRRPRMHTTGSARRRQFASLAGTAEDPLAIADKANGLDIHPIVQGEGESPDTLARQKRLALVEREFANGGSGACLHSPTSGSFRGAHTAPRPG